MLKTPKQSFVWALIALCIGLAAASRLLPHIPNFAPMAAMALFSGAFLRNKYMAPALTLAAVLLSDLLLPGTAFYPGFLFVYAGYAAVATLGWAMRGKTKMVTAPLFAVLGTLAFFTLSNFGVWLQGGLYPATAEGLMNCFEMALPFLRPTLVSDLLYATLFFGAAQLAARTSLKVAKA